MNIKFTKANFAKFSPISVIGTSIIHRIATSITLTTLFASNGMVFATMPEASTLYDKANAFGQQVEFFAQNTPDAQNTSEAEITVTDTLSSVAQRKPAEFNATVEALTPYVVEGQDGTVSINAPDEVIKTVDQDSYAAILDSINKTNQTLQGGGNAQLRALPRIPWSQIFNAVKRSGRWVWYKSHLCVAAVVREWSNITSNSPNPTDWVLTAALVCGNAMR